LRERTAGDFICLSSYQSVATPPADLLAEMALMKEVITAVRAFRTEKGISPKEPIDLFIKTEEGELFMRQQAFLKKFLNTDRLELVSESVDGTGSLRVAAHEFYIPLGAVDVEAEREKILKEIEYNEGFLQKVSKKLANERFVANAPEQVVILERKKLSDAEAKLEVLRQSLAELS
jgi:valyl-tRNA synthetase